MKSAATTATQDEAPAPPARETLIIAVVVAVLFNFVVSGVREVQFKRLGACQHTECGARPF